ncbi:DUF309 domain-containing protein [Nocardia cyriacigeorgica]|uniref:DUF309 domain-containing protein n=1 Tax=Nocardia cyriacigeorgica TaxID=135487 RepID=UPI0024562CFB|nr:DUF309 domain-containing protein [Nocardia cyriacigeorgica]
MVERDRDATGRALNSRPRDRFGRPLPPGSEGVPRIPDDLNLPPQQTLSYAQQLLDDGLAFNAHEVLEAAWKNGPFAERMLWQGLAQYAVGLTHIQRGNAKGAHTLLTRAINRISSFGEHSESDPDYIESRSETADPIPYGIDAVGLIAHAQTLLTALDAGTPITEDQLKPRLCGAATQQR